ncbi:tRNA lysidine(34) synthetase TilS [Brackiella oedipodis]|uniref:tRNA lysidine(34) synthetase TilS n=1 Tax=Brackiella oedipodis TaxID=124225 RepID=UPI0006889A8D|nr:tRNA lysidine(34) synthetase TilS [Brackiella oedipodis]
MQGPASLLAQIKCQRVALAFSGGADSLALALCLAYLCQSSSKSLILFHIHHGLMAAADDWLDACQQLANQLGLKFVARQVKVDQDSGLGMEGAARQARYQALQGLAAEHEVEAIFLAHHLQDHAENLLIRLFRGAGVKGMSGMQVQRGLQHSSEPLRYYRPWLDIERHYLIDLAQHWETLTGWRYIRDPSNLDQQYKRGAIRTQLIPVLQKIWPTWPHQLARFAHIMQETQGLLDELAVLDLQQLEPDTDYLSFSLKAWRELSEARQVNVIRYWLSLHHQLMPSEKRLQEWLKQLRHVHQLGFDRDVRLKHQQTEIRLQKGRVRLYGVESKKDH